jgi:hypothetical protein
VTRPASRNGPDQGVTRDFLNRLSEVRVLQGARDGQEAPTYHPDRRCLTLIPRPTPSSPRLPLHPTYVWRRRPARAPFSPDPLRHRLLRAPVRLNSTSGRGSHVSRCVLSALAEM